MGGYKRKMATAKLKTVKKAEEVATEIVASIVSEEIEAKGTEVVEPAQPILPGGPTQADIDLWKAELRKKGIPDKLTVLIVSGEEAPFIFRKISRPE
jgi:hypothetical protein